MESCAPDEASARPELPRPSAAATSKRKLLHRLIVQPVLAQRMSEKGRTCDAAGSITSSEQHRHFPKSNNTKMFLSGSSSAAAAPLSISAVSEDGTGIGRGGVPSGKLPSCCTPATALEFLISDGLDFIYLVQDTWDPYKLYIVPEAKHADEAYRHNLITMSKRGILKQENGETVRIELAVYLQEYKLYHRLKRIPIFRDFRLW